MGSKTKTNTKTFGTQTTRVDPRLDELAWGNYDIAKQVADDYKAISMSQMPGLNQDQLAVRDQIRAMQGQSTLGPLNDLYSNYLNFQAPQVAAPSVSTDFGFTSPTVSSAMASAKLANRGDIRDVANQNITAAQFSPEALERILAGMDPSYTNAVRDTTLADINRSRQLAQVPNADAAAIQGAFGGSRQGILEAETNRAYGDIAARTSADLNLNYFNIALGTLQSDLERQQQAGMFNSDAALRAALANQGIDANVALQNSQLGTQTAIANAGNATQAGIAGAQIANQGAIAQLQAKLEAQKANAQYGLTAGLANQDAAFRSADLGLTATDRLYELDNTARNRLLQDLEMLQSVGNYDYNISARNNEIDYMNAYNAQQAPLTALGIRLNAQSTLPTNPTVTSSGNSEQVTKQTPGLFDILGMGLQLGANFIPGGGILAGGSPAAPPRTPSLLESFGGNVPQAPNIGYQVPRIDLGQTQSPLNYRGYYY